MSTSDPIPLPDSEAATPQSAGEPARPASSAGTTRLRVAMWSLSLAVAAAILTWILGEAGLLTVKAAKMSYNMMGTPAFGETGETRAVAEVRTTSLTYGALGGLLGLALGLSGSVSAGRLGTNRMAPIVGLIAGIGAGSLGSLLFLPLYNRWIVDNLDEWLRSLILHCGLWGPLSATAGLAFGLGAGGWKRASRTLGISLACVILFVAGYELIGAFALPLSETSDAVPGTWHARLFAFVGVACFTVVGALLSVPTRAPAKS
jgi:hypothetical protein